MNETEKKQPTEAELRAHEEDLQKRVQGFNADLIPLLEKWRLALGAVPFISPDGRIGARPHVFDDPNVVKKDEKVEAKAGGLEKVE